MKHNELSTPASKPALTDAREQPSAPLKPATTDTSRKQYFTITYYSTKKTPAGVVVPDIVTQKVAPASQGIFKPEKTSVPMEHSSLEKVANSKKRKIKSPDTLAPSLKKTRVTTQLKTPEEEEDLNLFGKRQKKSSLKIHDQQESQREKITRQQNKKDESSAKKSDKNLKIFSEAIDETLLLDEDLTHLPCLN